MLRNRIKEIVYDDFYTITEIAEEMGMSYKAVHELINREDLSDTRLNTLYKLANVYGEKVDSLFYTDEEYANLERLKALIKRKEEIENVINKFARANADGFDNTDLRKDFNNSLIEYNNRYNADIKLNEDLIELDFPAFYDRDKKKWDKIPTIEDLEVNTWDDNGNNIDESNYDEAYDNGYEMFFLNMKEVCKRIITEIKDLEEKIEKTKVMLGEKCDL